MLVFRYSSIRGIREVYAMRIETYNPANILNLEHFLKVPGTFPRTISVSKEKGFFV